MISQEAVAHGITSAVKPFGEDHHLVGCRRDGPKAGAVGRIEAPLLPAERNDGHEPHVGMLHTKCQDRLGRREVESYGHSRKKGAETAFEGPADGCVEHGTGRAVVGSVPGKGHRRSQAGNHDPKVLFWPGLCNTFQHTKQRTNMKNTGIVIASLVGGMILGSALTMLLTPQSGPELRRKIKDLVGDQLDQVQAKIGEVENRIDEIRNQCGEE